ncbi:MAG: hypothetical protein IJF80_00510 [Clostridia bacterium]|nr:hypothetical protein [Clostridia bacterium]
MSKFIKKHSALFTAILINLAFLILVPLIAGFHYELQDDWFFADNILDGNYDYTFCNYFIQALSGVLQKLIYPLNAFIVLQILLCFVSFVTISYIFLKTFNLKKGLLFTLFFECIFAINAYSAVTFTKTAAILMTAGGLLMLFAYHSKKNISYSVLGILLVLLGSFYRFNIFYSVLAVFGFFILALILAKTEKPFFKSLFGAIKKVLSIKNIALILALFILVFGMNTVSKEIIYSGEGMDYYKEFNSARAKAIDYPFLPYELAPDKYEKIGISENDLKMFRDWHFDDEGFTSIETLKEIQKIYDTEEINLVYLLYTLRNIAFKEVDNILSLNPEGILVLAYVAAALAILLIYKKKSFLYVGFTTLGAALLYIYLYLGGRVNYRAVLSIWFAATVLLVYCTQFLEKREWQKKKSTSAFTASLAAVLSCVFLLVSLFVTIPKLSLENKEEYPEFDEFVLSSEDKFFALNFPAKMLVKYTTVYSDPITIAPYPVFEKCLFYGSAYYAHPSYNKMLAKAGIDNLYTDIIDNENVYFVDTDSVDMFVTYLNEQYGDEDTVYGYELVKTADEVLNIYKIVTVK